MTLSNDERIAKVAQAICNKMVALNLRVGDVSIAKLIHIREFMQIAEEAIAAADGEKT